MGVHMPGQVTFCNLIGRAHCRHEAGDCLTADPHRNGDADGQADEHGYQAGFECIVCIDDGVMFKLVTGFGDGGGELIEQLDGFPVNAPDGVVASLVVKPCGFVGLQAFSVAI